MVNNSYVIIPYKNKFIKFSHLENGRIIYKDYYLDLKTNKKIKYPWIDWINEFNFSIETYFHKPKFVHLFYEMGYLIEKMALNLISDETILAIDLEFGNFDFIDLKGSHKKLHFTATQIPDFNNYLLKFNDGYKELLCGNCYQFNLTEEFIYLFENYTPMDFIEKLWEKKASRGAFASATYLENFDTLFLSNSPECLFQIKNNIISSMPIKGTISCENDLDIFAKWNELISDQKSESELFMIADLMRNDLSRIDLPRTKIISKKSMLRVPKLLHQYTELSVELRSEVKIQKIIECMFPGGSITGAPKKRVMKILNELENRQRGFYCGSTILFYKDSKVASINIRSANINFSSNQLRYQAGGGITLRSTPKAEFEEISYKVSSFLSILTT